MGQKENFMQNKQNIRKTRKKYLLNKGKQGINKNVSLEVVFTKYKYTVRTIFTTYRKQYYRILANINEWNSIFRAFYLYVTSKYE